MMHMVRVRVTGTKMLELDDSRISSAYLIDMLNIVFSIRVFVVILHTIVAILGGKKKYK